ncbi:hypothetical protein MCEMRE182_01205 [Candidatus Nanopelagicaceae bacterium]
MKKVLIALMLPVLLLPSVADAADTPDEQFVISYDTTGESSLGIVIEDSQKLKNTYSSLQAFTADGTELQKSKYTSVENCKSVGVPNCGAEKYFNYFANLGECDSTLKTDCVQSVSATDSTGKSLKVNSLGAFPKVEPYGFTGSPELNLPTGGSTFIVDIPEAPHKGGTQYLVVAQVQGNKMFGESKFAMQQFNLGIFAVSKITGNYLTTGPALKISDFSVPLGGISGGFQALDLSTGKRAPCAQMTSTECYVAWPMPLDVKFGVTLKLHTQITGWLHGRTSDTTANISKAADGDQIVEVNGNPSIVPTVFTSFVRSQLPMAISDYYAARPDIAFLGYGAGERDPVTRVNKWLLKAPTNYTPQELEEVLLWYSALKDKAPYAATEWSLRSTTTGGDANNCFKDNTQLNGIVTTNSNYFLSGPPVFNKQEMALDYKVASPHFLPNGDVFKGIYNLAIRSNVARCLYGFSSAPVSATISIISADGTNQTATTVLSERNGWLYLTAAGFTFSSPIVRVALTQEAAPLPTPEMTTQASSKMPVKKVTITCVAGKVKKKITSTNPKCPKGYKKVA